MTRPTLVLLPGLLNDARLWQPVIAAVGDLADCKVADLTRHDSVAALAADVLQQVTAEQFALIGFSMGGYVALEIMRQAPHRVSALALVDTTARPDSAESTAARRALMQLAQTDFPAVIDRLLPRQLHPSHLQDAHIIESIRAMAATAGKDTFERQQVAIIDRPDSRPSLRDIRCPTLILCGREDAITPLDAHREMARSIDAAELVVVDQCGHMSLLEQPASVSDAVRRWLVAHARHQ